MHALASALNLAAASRAPLPCGLRGSEMLGGHIQLKSYEGCKERHVCELAKQPLRLCPLWAGCARMVVHALHPCM